MCVDSGHVREVLQREGFFVVDRLASPADLQEVRERLDRLFDQFELLPRQHAVDLGVRGAAEGVIRDVNRASSLDPGLLQTRLFKRCRDLAQQLVGRMARLTFDHAIYKPGWLSAPTPWHQDQAFVGLPVPLRAVHMWIPLQDVTRENGCMWFVPRSHLRGLLPHTLWANSDHSLEVAEVDMLSVRSAEVCAGGLTVHTPMTIHMTGANETDTLRRVWILHFAPWGHLGYLRPGNVLPLIRKAISVVR